MLYKQGDWIQYKHYIGRIVFLIPEAKCYMVELFDYHGMDKIHKQIEQYLLDPAYEQIEIGYC